MRCFAAICCIVCIAGMGLAACFGSGGERQEADGVATTVAATLTSTAQQANAPAQAGPTPTPITIAVLPVDGEDGNLSLSGRGSGEGRNVLLAGFAGSEVDERMVFRDRLVFQVEVYDPRVGSRDGDGIAQVQFNLFDANNYRVYTYTDATPGYCVFGGGSPDCSVLVFGETGNRWPNGRTIANGGYLAEIVIAPEQGEAAVWRWRFWIERN